MNSVASQMIIRVLIAAALLCVGTATPAADAAVSSSSFVRTIYLVRHGAYLPDPKANPQSGPGLSVLGIAQARLAATRLRSMPFAMDTLVSSNLTRAQQTAAIVREQLAGVPASSTALLGECTPPATIDLRESGGTLGACQRKLDAAFAKFFVPASGADRHDVLVCHGNVIRYLTMKSLGVDAKSWIGLSVAHASLTIVQVHPNGAMKVVAVGDAGHIPANLQSWGDDNDPNLVVPDASAFTVLP
jgi:serine/threonine-protein phosphatase PGAM5